MVYLHHKRNRRVDVLLVTLLRISRDKAFERFHKMETGKQTHRMCEINRRHKAAELMQLSNNCQVTTVSDIEWRVQSQSQQHIQYKLSNKMTTVNVELLVLHVVFAHTISHAHV